MKSSTAAKTASAAIAAALVLAGAGCRTADPGLVDAYGNRLTSLDEIWTLVDEAFPGGLACPVTVRLIERSHSGFDPETESVLISRSFSPAVARGKVALGLTHLALNRLSGGDGERRGRCFDDDVRFFEYAIASFMDRRAAGSLEKELPGAYAAAARLIGDGSLSIAAVRDWEVFCYRGRWADQYQEWNLEGLEALLTLGQYLINVRMWPPRQLSRVFEALADDSVTFASAFQETLDADLEETLESWRRHVLEHANPAG